jgi:hypothetical protein
MATSSSFIEANWTPLPPNYKLSEKFIPYIPQEPLFSKSGKTYYAPGSH